MTTLITGGLVVTSVRPWRAKAATIVIDDDTIVDIVAPGRAAGGRGVLDATGCLVLPGLINAHVHSGVALARGLFENMSLLEMSECEALNELLAAVSENERLHGLSSEATFLECVSTGTTFACDLPLRSLGRTTADAFARVGLRGAAIEHVEMGLEYVADQTKRLRAVNVEPQLWLHSEAKHGGLSNFEGNRRPELLTAIEEFRLGTHMHFAETTWRTRHIAANYGGRTTASVLDEWGLLRHGFVGAHAVHVTDDDIRLLAERGAGIVACPSSEMKLADGVAPIPALLGAGVTVGLGTDGAIYNNSNDMFAEMRSLCLLHQLHSGPGAMTAEDALYLATEGGAKLFGLGDQIGRIAVGYRADLVLVDTRGPRMHPLVHGVPSNVAVNLVFNAVGDQVRATMVDGHVVWQDGRHTSISADDLRLRLDESIRDLGLGAQ